MELTIFDHLLVAILFLVLPVLSVTDFRKLKSQLDAGKPAARLLFYRSIIVWIWGLTLAVAALWLVHKRGLGQLGFGLETGTGFWIGLALTVVACGLFIMQAIALRRNPKKLQALAKQFEPVKPLIPHTNQEAKEFVAVSITAGICEEILYRGYLMLYITSAIAIESMWPAALLSSLVFGLGHAYQGPKGVLRAGLFGLAMAGLYLLTGSIWLLIILHTLIDLVNGSLGRSVIAAGEAQQVQALDDT